MTRTAVRVDLRTDLEANKPVSPGWILSASSQVQALVGFDHRAGKNWSAILVLIESARWGCGDWNLCGRPTSASGLFR